MMSYVWGEYAAGAHSFEFSSTLFMQETIENIEKKSGKYGFIYSATIHQGDELFSVEQSRGKECAFMSFSAVLTAQHNPLIDWSTTTFNNVLLQGGQNVFKSSK